MQVKIKLIGKDGELHGEGEVESDKISEAHVLERNKQLYAFQRMEGFTSAIFRECGQAVLITEF